VLKHQYGLAIFDFDGTLADTFPFFLSVFNRTAEKHGFDRIDTSNVEALRHYNPRQMMRHVRMPAWKLSLVSKDFIELMRQSTAGLKLFDGIPEALSALHGEGVRLAVVSSNSEHNVRQVLGPELSALIADFACGMSIFGKASHIRKVLKNAGLKASDAIYIGDQDTDAQAAHKVGMPFGAVHWGYAPIEALRARGVQAEFERPADLVRIARSSAAIAN
jgi:phosphoglycolate phosphatase